MTITHVMLARVPHASPPGPNSPSGILSSSPTNTVPFPAAGVSAQLNNVQSEETHVHAQTIPGQATHPSPTHRGSVGVGISPAATSEAMEVPQNAHGRRSSERWVTRFWLMEQIFNIRLYSHHGARISPPGTTRDGGNPSSSFPIQHPGAFGSSPVKASSLARRLDEEMEQ